VLLPFFLTDICHIPPGFSKKSHIIRHAAHSSTTGLTRAAPLLCDLSKTNIFFSSPYLLLLNNLFFISMSPAPPRTSQGILRQAINAGFLGSLRFFSFITQKAQVTLPRRRQSKKSATCCDIVLLQFSDVFLKNHAFKE
jgi:hypothetical protein